MKRPTRILALFISSVVTLLLVACGDKNKGADPDKPEGLEKAIENISNQDQVQTTMEKQVLSESIAVIKKHADKGNVDAMYWMAEGRLLDSTDQNYVSLPEAVKYLEKAAQNGSVDAALQLAEIFSTEKSLRNPQIAYQWYYIGYFKKDGKVHELNPKPDAPVEGDFRTELNVDALVKELGAEKIKEIEKQAKDWLAKYHKPDSQQ